MPQIIPIKDLKNTADISERCHNSKAPIFITKNGYGDMVIMSVEVYEGTMERISAYKDMLDSNAEAADEISDKLLETATNRVVTGD